MYTQQELDDLKHIRKSIRAIIEAKKHKIKPSLSVQVMVLMDIAQQLQPLTEYVLVNVTKNTVVVTYKTKYDKSDRYRYEVVEF
jgi:hypothetical protein